MRGEAFISVGRERDSPEIACLVFLLNKLNSVSRQAVCGSELRDNPRRNLNIALILHPHNGTNDEIAAYLNGSSTLVQVDGFRGHRKGALQPIFARYPHGRMQKYSVAAAPSDLTSGTAGGGR